MFLCNILKKVMLTDIAVVCFWGRGDGGEKERFGKT